MKFQEVPIQFPHSGLNVSSEYGRQPADTTQLAQNVRSYDTFEQRKRGGSRAGLSKLVNETLNGDNPIQHLALIVDPTTPAIAADHDGTVTDTSTNNLRIRNPGRSVRPGGSGRPINRNIGDTPAATLTFRQATSDQAFGASDDGPLAPLDNDFFIEPVADGDLLILFVWRISGFTTPSEGSILPSAAQIPISVTNIDGSKSYTQLGTENSNTYTYDETFNGEFSTQTGVVANSTLSVWTLVSDGAAEDSQYKVTVSGGGCLLTVGVAYRNQAGSTPVVMDVQDAVSGTFDNQNIMALGTGQIDVPATNSSVIVAVCFDTDFNPASDESPQPNPQPAITPSGGFTEVDTSTSGSHGRIFLYYIEDVDTSAELSLILGSGVASYMVTAVIVKD